MFARHGIHRPEERDRVIEGSTRKYRDRLRSHDPTLVGAAMPLGFEAQSAYLAAMLNWLRNVWQRTTTSPCQQCGELIPVTEYRETGNSRDGTWWSGYAVELECPKCGHTFWSKK
jgi:predicted RNA-binding Zn-ribbon protein involved in translation (DUF1610 family)